jgi:hypothetical protein
MSRFLTATSLLKDHESDSFTQDGGLRAYAVHSMQTADSDGSNEKEIGNSSLFRNSLRTRMNNVAG